MATKGRVIKDKPRLLWISDAVAHTGFATVTHSVLQYLKHSYDVSVLGVNYFGDPHKYDYPIYPAPIGGDVFGIKRIPDLVRRIKPHITLMVNDPWLVKDYIEPLNTPIGQIDGTNVFTHKVAYMPIDGKNIQPQFIQPLNALEHAIFYTKFGLDEARNSGFTGESASIIPHGVDHTDFSRMTTQAARNKLGGHISDDWFVVGCINRNQPRKRLDLALRYFRDWAADKPKNVKLYYHGALHDIGWNILQLADYYNIDDRMIITSPELTTAVGVPREMLKYIYNSFDVQITTTLGEGWGLTQAEGMSCGVPQIVPDWSALGEWARGGVAYVECDEEQANSGGLNTIGGIANRQKFIAELNRMYYDHKYRTSVGKAGYDLIHQPQFSWENVAKQFDEVLKKVMYNR